MAGLNPSAVAIGEKESSELAPPPAADTKRLTRAQIPLLDRLQCFIKLWLFKSLVSTYLSLIRLILIIRRNNTTGPTYTKIYPIRPTQLNRVFIPKSHKPGTTHPLLITFHGSGFALGNPSMDDSFNRALSDDHNLVVIGVNYRKAPSHPFPIPVHDAAEITRAILSDRDLPIDHTRQASLAGFSAGGNLALAIAQLPGIKKRISAVVPIYPVVDFTGQFKGPFVDGPDGKPDRLRWVAGAFNWGYLPVGTNLADPLLSVACAANRTALPQRVFFIAAEYDYLYYEAEVMARMLAFGKFEGKVGDKGTEWGEVNGVRWWNVQGMVHGWTHNPVKAEEEVLKQNMLKTLRKRMAEFIAAE